jgi:hypothetical protein
MDGRRVAPRIKPTPADVERFFRYVTKECPAPAHCPELGPCWIWTGSLKTKAGYGQFIWGGHNRSAHAFGWEHVNGPIPPHLQIDHLCRVTGCVRASHMEVVTHAENMRRRRLTTCRRGHDFAVHGFYLAHGKPRCRRCILDRQAARTRSARSLPDRRIKIDQMAKRAAVEAVLLRKVGTADAARELGCSPKYLDKVVRKERRLRETSTS